MIDAAKVGRQIADLRKVKGLTQSQLGERLNISFQAVSKWERGVSHGLGYHTTNPRLHYFQNIKFWRYPQ